MLPALRWSEASSTRIILAVKSRSLSLRANSSLQRKPDAAANRMIVAYCSLRAAPKLSIVCRCAAICSACFQEYETLRRLLIRISSLSRSGISSAPKEKGGFLSFENEDRTRCIVLSESLIEVQETPASLFPDAHSFTASMRLCFFGTFFDSFSRCVLIRALPVETVEG